jgi:hypothetical protein
MLRLKAVAFAGVLFSSALFPANAAPRQSKPSNAVKTSVASAKKQKRKTPARPPNRRVLMRSVGLLSAGYCVQTYHALRALSELIVVFGKKRKSVAARAELLWKMTRSVRRNTELLSRHALGGDDRLTVSQLLELLKILEEQSRRLHRFARSRSAKDYRLFEAQRGLAWRKLKSMLKD